MSAPLCGGIVYVCVCVCVCLCVNVILSNLAVQTQVASEAVETPGSCEFPGTALKAVISPFSTMLANKEQDRDVGRGRGRAGRKGENKGKTNDEVWRSWKGLRQQDEVHKSGEVGMLREDLELACAAS